MKMFSVKDSKSGIFFQPFFFRTIPEAIRSFTDEANSDPANSMISKHPSDYALYSLGDFDDTTGDFSPSVSELCTAISVKKEVFHETGSETFSSQEILSS